jgi:hypothetical protein
VAGIEDVQAWNIHQAKLLHDIRDSPSKGTLYHFSNFQHWKETVPQGITEPGVDEWLRRYHVPCATCRVLLSILHISESNRSEIEYTIIADQAFQDFALYFNALDSMSTANYASLTSLDGVEIFCTAIGLLYVIFFRSASAQGPGGAERTAFRSMQKPSQLLAKMAEKFSLCGSLKDILQRFLDLVTSMPTVFDCQNLLQDYDDVIPRSAQRLMEQVVEFRLPMP